VIIVFFRGRGGFIRPAMLRHSPAFLETNIVSPVEHVLPFIAESGTCAQQSRRFAILRLDDNSYVFQQTKQWYVITLRDYPCSSIQPSDRASGVYIGILYLTQKLGERASHRSSHVISTSSALTSDASEIRD